MLIFFSVNRIIKVLQVLNQQTIQYIDIDSCQCEQGFETTCRPSPWVIKCTNNWIIQFFKFYNKKQPSTYFLQSYCPQASFIDWEFVSDHFDSVLKFNSIQANPNHISIVSTCDKYQTST